MASQAAVRFLANVNFARTLSNQYANVNVQFMCFFALNIILAKNINGSTTAFIQFNKLLIDVVTKVDNQPLPIMFIFLNDNENAPLIIDINFLSLEKFHEVQLIFTNASTMPRRNSYFPWQKVSPVTIGKFLASYVASIVFVTLANFDAVSNLNLQHKTRVDYDIFIIVGEQQALRDYFLTPFGVKLRNRIGIIFSFRNDSLAVASHDASYLIDPPVYNNGTIKLSSTVPGFKHFSMNGRRLLVSANTLAPYIVYISPTNIPGGTHYMMLMLSASVYNFSLVWDINPSRGNGKLEKDGSASGMLGDVLKGKADIAFIARLTLGQIGVIDLTTSNYVDTLVFLTRRPEAYLEWTAVIHLFTVETWGIILLAFLAVIPLYYLKLRRSNLSAKPVKPFKAFMIPFGILLTQSIPTIPKRAYPLTFFWMMFVLNLNIAYNSNLSSVLTKLQPEAVPLSFDDLANRLDYNISFNYLNNGSCDCFHFFNQSTTPLIMSIKERFMHNLEPDTGRCIVRALVKRKTVCIGWESVTMIGIGQNATIYSGVNLVTVSKSVHSSRNSIGFQRHSIYTKTFDKAFGWFRDMGIVFQLKKKAEAAAMGVGQSWLNSRKHSKIYKVLKKFVDDLQNTVRPFKLTHFTFAYLLLFGGSFVAAAIFFLEHMASTNMSTKAIAVEYSP